MPAAWQDDDNWTRRNLWRGHDYFYDADAVRTPIKVEAMTRLVRNRNTGAEVPPGASQQKGLCGAVEFGQNAQRYLGIDGKDFRAAGVQDARAMKSRIMDTVRAGTIAGANRKNVWTITTKPFMGPQFATFPPDLVEQCLLPGTSERGVCATCGAPWVRRVRKTFEQQPDVSIKRGLKSAR